MIPHLTRRNATGRAAIAGLVLLFPLSLAAQDRPDAGGIWMRFNLSQTFEAIENSDLEPESEGSTFRSSTRLGFGLTSQTRTNFVGLRLSTALRYLDSPDPEEDVDLSFGLPRGEFTYRRTALTSQLNLGLSLDEQDVSFLRATGDLIDDDGETVDDFADLSGRGTRRTFNGNVGLNFGIDTPTEGGVSLNLRRVTYRDVTDSDLEDFFRYAISGNLQHRLASDLTLSSRVAYINFDESDENVRETYEFALGLSHRRARGTANARLSLRNVEEGTSISLRSGWERTLPAGAIGLSLGVANSAEDTTSFVGGVTYTQDFIRGQFTTSLQQNLSSGTDEEEDLITAFRAGYSHNVSPLTAIRLDMRYTDRDSLTDDDRTQRTEFGIGVNHTLTEDWELSAGYRRVFLDENDEDRAESDRIFVTLGRSLSIRP